MQHIFAIKSERGHWYWKGSKRGSVVISSCTCQHNIEKSVVKEYFNVMCEVGSQGSKLSINKQKQHKCEHFGEPCKPPWLGFINAALPWVHWVHCIALGSLWEIVQGGIILSLFVSFSDDTWCRVITRVTRRWFDTQHASDYRLSGQISLPGQNESS